MVLLVESRMVVVLLVGSQMAVAQLSHSQLMRTQRECSLKPALPTSSICVF